MEYYITMLNSEDVLYYKSYNYITDVYPDFSNKVYFADDFNN